MTRRRRGSRKSGEMPEPLQNASRQALAARPGKWKGIQKHRAYLLLEMLAQKFPGPMKPGFYRLRVQVEQGSSFFDAHALDHARHENDAEDIRQAVGRALDKVNNLSLRHDSFRICRCGRVWECKDLYLRRSFLETLPICKWPSTPQPFEGLVHGDP